MAKSPRDFKSVLAKIYGLLNAAEYGEAERLLVSLQPEGPAESRMREHLLAQVAMFRGELPQALERLNAARAKYGDHVAILSDLANAYYLLGRFAEWRSSTHELERTFEKAAGALSENSRFRTQLVLARFYEEEGRIGQALTSYEKLADEISESGQPRKYLNLLAQILRLRAMYGVKKGLGEIYRKLHELETQDSALQLDITVQHALILAEAELVGTAHAQARMSQLLSRENLTDSDRRLVFYDFLENVLCREVFPKEILKEHVPAPGDDYERALHALAFGSRPVNLADELLRVSRKLPLASCLRIFNLHLLREDSSTVGEEIRQRIILLLDSVDTVSQELWSGKLRSGLAARDVVLTCFPSTYEIACGAQRRNLSRKRNMFALLVELADDREIDLDRAIRVIWKANYNPSYYHRVRVMTRRLNRILFELTGIAKGIQVSQNAVERTGELKIVVTEE